MIDGFLFIFYTETCNAIVNNILIFQTRFLSKWRKWTFGYSDNQNYSFLNLENK